MSQFEAVNAIAALIHECDQLLKQSRIRAAIALLNDLNLSAVPRRQRQALAKICRRAGAIEKGLRLLQPVVRDETLLHEPANPGEMAEYSVLLSRNGSIAEALQLLSIIDVEKAPEALLYTGFCHVSRWDYDEANRCFEKILHSNIDDGYTRLIAQVNLAAGLLVLGENVHCDELLSEALELAQAQSATRLIGNILELRGGSRVLRGEISSARADLNAATEIFKDAESSDQLLVRKWHAVIHASETGSIEPLLQFRAEALRRMQWESVREADLFILHLNLDQKLFDYITFGTPMRAYRQRVKSQINLQPSKYFIWGDSGREILNLRNLQGPVNGVMKPGKKIHHLLLALSRDFYLPLNLGSLFAEVYPDVCFDVDSSPLLIRQLVKRARNLLKTNGIRMNIMRLESGYQMRPERGFGVQLELERLPESTATLQWELLTKHFPPGKDFTSRDACERIHVCHTSFRRLIAPGLREGSVCKSGRGKSVKYRLAG